MNLTLPRGRKPTNPSALPAYINKVAQHNNVSYAKAEEFVKGKIGNIGITLTQPTPQIHIVRTDAEILQMVASRFTVLNELAMSLAKGTGKPRALIVSGAGGVGKTHTITSKLEHGKENNMCSFDMISGSAISAINLHMKLFENRDKAAVTVLDDADSVWGDEYVMSALKVALDTKAHRRISYLTESTILKDAGVPKVFDFYGAMIFLTNIDFQAKIDEGRSKMIPHIQALLTRAMYLDLGLHEPRELSIWVEYMVTKHHILVQEGLTYEQEKAVLKWMQGNRDKLRNLSIRTAVKIGQLMQIFPDKWESFAFETECKRG